MPTTPRLLIPYPDKNSNPWDAVFQAMVLAIDASLYTTREDRNIIISGGGTMSFTAGSGVLTWSAPINLLAAVTGYTWTIPAGNVVLQDGQLFYITVTRAPQSNTTYTPVVGSSTPNQPNGDSQILIGVRIGSVVHFRDGFVIMDGQSTTIFNTNLSPGLLIPGQTLGDVLYFDGTNWTRLPAGTPGKVLTTEGAAPPQWTTPAGGGSAGAIQPRGLSNRGPGSTNVYPSFIPVGSMWSATSTGVRNLVYDSTVLTLNGNTFGPYAWGVRSNGADVFKYDDFNEYVDIVELNDVAPGAQLISGTGAVGALVLDGSKNVWTIERTSNALVEIQNEPPLVKATYPIPNSDKTQLAYDSGTNKLILLDQFGRNLASFDLVAKTFSADVPFPPPPGFSSLDSVYAAGGFVFVSWHDFGFGTHHVRVDKINPATLLTTAHCTFVVSPSGGEAAGFDWQANSGTPKLFVSAVTQIARIDVTAMTVDTTFTVPGSSSLGGIAIGDLGHLWVTDTLANPSKVYDLSSPFGAIALANTYTIDSTLTADTISIVWNSVNTGQIVASYSLDKIYDLDSGGGSFAAAYIAGGTNIIIPTLAGNVLTDGGPGNSPSWSALDYPNLLGTGTNTYTGTGKIGNLDPTQTTLNWKSSTDYVDGFVGYATSNSASWVTIATLDLSAVAGSVRANDWSVSIIGYDSGSSGGSTPIYRTDLVFTAFWNGAIPVLVPASPTQINVRTNGTTTGYNAQVIQSGNHILVQVQGGSGGHTVHWTIYAQVGWVF